MKLSFKTKLVFVIFTVFMLFSSVCMAAAVPTSDIAPTGNTEVTNNTPEATYKFVASDVYEYDQDVTVDTTVDGNVFAFGNNITINGEIGGDVFAFGGSVTISDKAYVHGSIFVFAQNVTINGICYDVYAACQSLTLGKGAIVARDLRVGADKVTINGQVKRDAYLDINSLVFPEGETERISGNLSYTADTEFTISNEVVKGSIKYTPDISQEVNMAAKIVSIITKVLSAMLYSLAVVLLVIWLAPNFKQKATAIFKKKALLSLGTGILATLAIVAGSIAFLLITGGLGLHISAAVIAIFILALTISKTVFSMATAQLILDKLNKNNPVLYVVVTLLVVLVVSLLAIIPYIGGLVGFIVSMIGFGIIVLNLIKKNMVEDTKTEAEAKA